MESTTLEQAAESLLAPAEDNSGGDNLDEAVNSMIEPDDGQSEEVEVSDEDQDDVEASSDEDYDDAEIDDEDLVEAPAEDTNLEQLTKIIEQRGFSREQILDRLDCFGGFHEFTANYRQGDE